MKRIHSASRHTRLPAAALLFAAAQLVACGGGGNSGNDVVTPPPPPPPPATVSLTLSGKVTDQPIPGAEITVIVGDESFTAVADANGNYTIDLEIEEGAVSDFVSLHARGVNEQDFVVFNSLAGSFSRLSELAGDDDTLSSDENLAVQITNVSTAEAALLQEANGGQPVTTDDALRSLGTAVNGQDVLDLATAIKLAVDSSADYPLPAGTTIEDIVSDADAWPEFVNDTRAQDPAAFSAAQTAIAEDPDLKQPLEEDDVPEQIKAAILSTDAGFTFNLINRVADYRFNADGTGRAAGGNFDQSMTWSTSGSSVIVQYQEPLITTGFPSENCDGIMRQVEAGFTSYSVSLSLLSARTLAITETTDIEYLDCPSLQSRTVTETVARTILVDDDFPALDVAELAGTAQTIYVHDASSPEIPVTADIADLAADGTGTTRLKGKSFTWSVSEDGLEAIAEFADGSTGRYRLLRDLDSLGSDMFYEIETANATYIDADVSVFLDPELPLAFDAANVVGSHYQFGIGEETVADARLDGFRIRIDQGNVGAQVYDFIDEQGNVVTVDETVDQYNALRWHIDGVDLVLRRTFDDTTFDSNCMFGSQSCVLSDERRQIPLGSFDMAAATRSYVLEQRRSNRNGITVDTPTTYLVRFYDTPAAASGSAKPAARDVARVTRAAGPVLR